MLLLGGLAGLAACARGQASGTGPQVPLPPGEATGGAPATESSGAAAEQAGDPRVTVIRHPVNKGVGGAVLSGYRAALAEGFEIIVKLDGDEPTKKVLGDARLNGFEIQAQGKFSTPVRFSLSLAHLRPLLVRDKGQWKLVTYWCEICSIRAFTPGPCACCQRNTELDLRDPEHPDQA